MLVRRRGDALDVLDGAAREVHMRGHDQCRAVVDGSRDRVDGYADAVGTLDDHELHPCARFGEPLIRDRGKIERRDHHFRATAVID